MGRKLRILFVAPRYHTNQHFAIQSLIEGGHQVQFYAWMQGHSEEYSALTPRIFSHARLFQIIAKVLAPPSREEFLRKYAFPPLQHLFIAIREFDPDGIVIRNPNYLFSLFALMFGFFLRKKIIIYTQGPKYYRGLKRHLAKGLIIKLTKAEWITPVKGKCDEQHLTWPQIHYLPFVIPPRVSPSERSWFRKNKIHLLTVGKFVERKNHILLLKAFEVLSKQHPHLTLTIVGEVSTEHHRLYFEKVKKFIEAKNLKHKVSIRPNLSFQEVLSLYPLHDLFVLPSRDEPAAVSPLEAMAHSLPVLCSDTCGTRWYIEEGLNGYIFQTDNLDDLVEKIEACVSNKEKLISMGKYSYSLVKRQHSPQRYREFIESLLQESTYDPK